MPINARQLQKNSSSVLDAVVQRGARVDGTPPVDNPSSVDDQFEISASSELRQRSSPDTNFQRDAAGDTDAPWYRREPWLVAQLLAFAPILAAMVVPKAYQLPLFGLGGLLVVIGMVLLIRRELTASRSAAPEDPRAA